MPGLVKLEWNWVLNKYLAESDSDKWGSVCKYRLGAHSECTWLHTEYTVFVIFLPSLSLTAYNCIFCVHSEKMMVISLAAVWMVKNFYCPYKNAKNRVSVFTNILYFVAVSFHRLILEGFWQSEDTIGARFMLSSVSAFWSRSQGI